MISLYEIICKEFLLDETQNIVGGGSVMGVQFDFIQKNIRSRRKYFMKNGKVIPQEIKLTDGRVFNLTEDTPLLPSDEFNIQKLYDDYIFSQPSKMNNYENGYFCPKSSDELTFDELVHGEDRVKAKYKLESYILLGIVSERLKWQNNKHWFWRGNNGLIIYRSWFE